MIRLGVQSYPNWLGFLASVWLETEVTDRISANIRLSNSTVKGELTTLGDCNTSDLVDLERMTVWGAIIRYALETLLTYAGCNYYLEWTVVVENDGWQVILGHLCCGPSGKEAASRLTYE